MSTALDSEATVKSLPEEPKTTFYYTDTRSGRPVEVNGVAHAEFTAHHIVFRDRAGVILHVVLARFVDDLVQQVAA